MNYRASQSIIAREAIPFAVPLALVTIVVFLLGFKISGFLCLGMLIFVVAFFRNPQRRHYSSEGAVISGADGKIVAAGLMPHADFPGGQCLRIAIFMSVFNVHVNWSPVAGRVIFARHFPGRFINAYYDKCAEENERKVLVVETETGHRVEVKLIAGLVARRIVCPVEEGDVLSQGEKVGLIRFGSRVEILLPADSALHVRVGMNVRGGETLVATLPSDAAASGN